MEEISTELVKLDKQRANKPKGSSGFLLSMVQKLTTSEEMDKKSKKLKKMLQANVDSEDNQLIDEFNEFFKHCITISHKSGYESAKKENPNKQQGFLSKLLGSGSGSGSGSDSKSSPTSELNNTTEKDNKSHDKDVPPLNQEEIEKSIAESINHILENFIDSLDYPLAQRNALKDKLFSTQPSPEIHILFENLAKILRKENFKDLHSGKISKEAQQEIQLETHHILIRLLEFIPLNEELQKEAERLKKDFSRGISANQLPDALEAIAKLVVQMQMESQKEQKDFKLFLISMSGRLKEVDSFLTANLDEHKDSWAKGAALSNSVKENVKDIETSVNEATDLNELGQNIQLKVENILSNVESYQKNENQRVKRIQQQNQALKNKVKHLEEESGALQVKIISSQEKAYKDPLTGLPNRLAYDQFLTEEYARWKRYHENLLFIIWDIDFFKKVNDTHGHHAGDEVLCAVSKLLRANLREPDFIARFGGEEFVTLMPNTSLGGGFKVAEKVRQAVQDLGFLYKGVEIPLTISCGISLFGGEDTPEDVFERADKALYQAKEQGRNRCVISQN